ncbi:MAG: orotidine-5'-phosphate decarboxylase [Candidatus Staskawiczbacteria bacterium]|nr:orotidine-5'-phosphate decarboxylase [Candidatus Staskawiczbacteria bacterium]
MFDFLGSCWLCPGEQDEVIDHLVNSGLIKWDNARSLPLKSGGKTDIYINLRMMRSRPNTTRFLASLFANPLRRLRLDRFVEVPEAVSLLAGVVSVETQIPAVTIREQTKEDRVVSGQLIGDLNPGERVAVLDDVITDGASKIPALTTLRKSAAEIAGLVVLCDRQQGWKTKLAEAGFGDVSVWPGFTLHDVRKYLVGSGLMTRCDKVKEQKNPLIVALDGKSWEEILPLVDRLRTSGCILKVNDLLVDQGIAKLLPDLSVYGRVMADLKGHDIPNTVGNICRRLRACPPWAVTVHASGGGEMVKAAKKELEGTGTLVLAVTVLTSIDQKTCEEVYHCNPADKVTELALMADAAGADGFVCSPHEVASLRKLLPGAILVIAGVRSSGETRDDQKRIGTPRAARKDGANYLVMGRQILGAVDPVGEVNRVAGVELGVEL